MSELDKDKVLEDFSKAYKASNGKKPSIDANNGWYSVNDGKNMRLAELDAWTKELEKASAKKAKKEPKKDAKQSSTRAAKTKAPSSATKKSSQSKATTQAPSKKRQSKAKPASKTSTSKGSGVKSSSEPGLSAKEAWKQYLDSQASDSALPRGVH